MIRTASLLAALAIGAAPAFAQRSAVSAGLSPEMAAEAFKRAVLEVCVPAAAGNGVSALDAARTGTVQPTQDAEARRQAGASTGETVWEVTAARGVVTLREAPGRCVVSVYGPNVSQTLAALQEAAQPSAARMFLSGDDKPSAGPEVISLEVLTVVQGKQVSIVAQGNQPGDPGHQSRFSVITATVSAVG